MWRDHFTGIDLIADRLKRQSAAKNVAYLVKHLKLLG